MPKKIIVEYTKTGRLPKHKFARKVLKLSAEGMSLREIAAKYGMSKNTIMMIRREYGFDNQKYIVYKYKDIISDLIAELKDGKTSFKAARIIGVDYRIARTCMQAIGNCQLALVK